MLQTSNLRQIEFDAWHGLRDAVKNSESPLRYLTYCTIGVDNAPKARTLVLRAVDTRRRELEFHTDIRSPKWGELEREPKSTVIGFSQYERIQLRFEGRASIYPPESERKPGSAGTCCRNGPDKPIAAGRGATIRRSRQTVPAAIRICRRHRWNQRWSRLNQAEASSAWWPFRQPRWTGSGYAARTTDARSSSTTVTHLTPGEHG